MLRPNFTVSSTHSRTSRSPTRSLENRRNRMPASPPNASSGAQHWTLPWLLLPVTIAVVVAGANLARSKDLAAPLVSSSNQTTELEAKFVGVAQCASCHERANARWRGSHHQLAMQPASNSTVLGNFNHAS